MLSSKHVWYLAMLWETSLSVLALTVGEIQYGCHGTLPPCPVQGQRFPTFFGSMLGFWSIDFGQLCSRDRSSQILFSGCSLC